MLKDLIEATCTIHFVEHLILHGEIVSLKMCTYIKSPMKIKVLSGDRT